MPEEEPKEVDIELRRAYVQGFIMEWRKRSIAALPEVRFQVNEFNDVYTTLYAYYKSTYTRDTVYNSTEWESMFEFEQIEVPLSGALAPFAKNMPSNLKRVSFQKGAARLTDIGCKKIATVVRIFFEQIQQSMERNIAVEMDSWERLSHSGSEASESSSSSGLSWKPGPIKWNPGRYMPQGVRIQTNGPVPVATVLDLEPHPLLDSTKKIKDFMERYFPTKDADGK